MTVVRTLREGVDWVQLPAARQVKTTPQVRGFVFFVAITERRLNLF